jgi:SAM-dependent methyltransferase
MGSYSDQLRRLLERPERAPNVLFRDVDDDFWLWLNTHGRDECSELADLLPGVPDAKVQKLWTGGAGLAALTGGFTTYQSLRDLHVELAGPLEGPVLDFGCGWGRIIRYFSKDLPAENLWGSDTTESLLQFCRSALPAMRFDHNETWPPLAHDDGTVGFLYAYSVFSHFSEPLHRAWLDEFWRVLKPGGIAAVSIRPRGFIEWCEKQRGPDPWPDAAPFTKRMFLDSQAALDAYDRGEFCYSPYNQDDPDAWWGEAVIPQAYVRREWSKRFEVMRVRRGLQPLVVLRKP